MSTFEESFSYTMCVYLIMTICMAVIVSVIVNTFEISKMAVSSSNAIHSASGLLEENSITRPSLFNGTNYAY